MKVTYYSIVRIGTKETYVGSSINLRSRWKKHRYDLKRGSHHCPALSEAWQIYGPQAFRFSVIEERECKDINERAAIELRWIKEIGTYNTMTHYIVPDNLAPMTEASRALKSIESKAAIAANPEYAAWLTERGDAMANYMKTDEGRAKMAEHTKRRWKDPEESKRLRAGLIARWKDPDNRKIHAAKISAAHGTPEMKALHKANTKALWETPEYREKVSKKAAANRWGDPEAKARQAEKMRAYHAKRRGGA